MGILGTDLAGIAAEQPGCHARIALPRGSGKASSVPNIPGVNTWH
jgi:hypothetical protein